MSDEYDIGVCGCEECPACLRREVRSLEKALQVMSDGRADDVSKLREAFELLDGPDHKELWSDWRSRCIDFVKFNRKEPTRHGFEADPSICATCGQGDEP